MFSNNLFMENVNLNQEILNKLNQLIIDVEFIKESVGEVELTDFAKNELKISRQENENEYTSLEEL